MMEENKELLLGEVTVSSGEDIPLEPTYRYFVTRKGVVMLSCLAVEDALYVLRVYHMDTVTRSDGKLLAFQRKNNVDIKEMMKLGE
jgi:hypothetical protein